MISSPVALPPVRCGWWFWLVALAVTIATPAIGVAAPPPGIPDGWSSGYVYANGVRLHYYRAVPAPGKPVLVMVHGITDNGLCWTTLTWKLQDAYDIYMVDTRGHGLSDPFTASDNGDTLIKDVVAFVGALGLERPVLVGHSMGGATVMRVGAEYPELARAVVMLDPGGFGGRGPAPARPPGAPAGKEPSGTKAVASTAPRPADPMPTPMNGSPEVLVRMNNYAFEDLVAKARRQNPKWDLVDCQYWALSKKQYHGAYSSEAWQVMSGSMRVGDALAKIPVPTLILKADASAEVRQTHVEAAKVMQKGRLVHVDDAGHNLHHDQLERTTALLREFLGTL